MSLKEEDRQILVELELEKAEKTFCQVEVLCQVGRFQCRRRCFIFTDGNTSREVGLQLFFQRNRSRRCIEGEPSIVVYRKSQAIHCLSQQRPGVTFPCLRA